MKPLSLFFCSIMFSWISFSQISDIAMEDECSFFMHLQNWKNSNYSAPSYLGVKSNFSQRSALLKRLETYVIVFNNYNIAPMLLEDSNEALACNIYVREYYRNSGVNETDATVFDLKEIQNARRIVQNDKKIFIRELLMDITDLNQPDNKSVEMLLAEFEDPFILEFLYQDLQRSYFDQELDRELFRLPQITKESNLRLIATRMDRLDNEKYIFYETYNSEPQAIKGFEMYHDNDVFMFGWNMNQDREYTGGFKFTASTDYLKWRFYRPGNGKIGRMNGENLLTYQSVSLGGSGYTPYIRYRNNFELADSLHNYDRPFASYMFIERAKHRTWRNGLVKQSGEFQVGAIGISQGRKIQAQLHKDLIHESQFVYGWDKQIANGGRFAFQLNQEFDFLLWSNTNRYKTVFRPHTILTEKIDKYLGGNISAKAEVKIGTVLTSIGGGIRFSTLDFLSQSANQMLLNKPKQTNNTDEWGFNFDIGLSYRYVVHNSMLEGLGLINTFKEDPYDDEGLDVYSIRTNQVVRNLFILDWGLNVRFRKTTLFYRQTIHTLEYKSDLESFDYQDPNYTSLVNSADASFYNDKVVREQTSFVNYKVFGRTIYGFGTLGISWIID